MKRASFLGVSSRRLEKEMATHSIVLAWRIPGMGEPGGPLEKEMASNSGILAWRNLWMKELGGLLSVGLHRVGHD